MCHNQPFASVPGQEQFAVNDPVRFQNQGRTVTGHIARKTSHHAAVVDAGGTAYKVPWEFLESHAGGQPKRVTLPSDEAKSRFRPGDSVRFEFRSTPLRGRIASFGPKRAAVHVEGHGQFRVPYGMLEMDASRPERDDGPRLERVAALAEGLMSQHGLKDWSFQFDDATKRAGSCVFETRVIALSRLHSLTSSEDEVRNTILHEIAHALCGPEHHHDRVWKATARSIGCSGDRCHQIEFAPPKYIASCPRCNWHQKRNRRMRRAVCKRCGQAVLYQAYTEEEWERAAAP